MKKYLPNYNWIYADRPRNQAAHGGFDSHVPSNDPAQDYIALLAEVKLASQCTKFVHGHSGFVSIIKEAMREAGNDNVTSYYVNTAVSKSEARKLKGVARGDIMLRMIEEHYKNLTESN